jgi:hypothetical protein
LENVMPGVAEHVQGEQRGDRRFFQRADPGRRAADRAQTQLLPNETDAAKPRATAGSYLFLFAAIALIFVVSVRAANLTLAPLLNDPQKTAEVAAILHEPQTYFTYDLNIETRRLRREHIAGLHRAPELAIMGASHWQEAHAWLAPGTDFYNAHIHRDYYEDIVAVVGWFARHDRLPKTLILSIRDNQFLPVEARADYLWVPGLPDYRAAAPMFGIEPHRTYAGGLTPQLRQVMSLPLLWSNVRRYVAAPEQPHAGPGTSHPTLDALLPDGSIEWSEAHRASFTDERARGLALAFAETKRNDPPLIDPEGVEAVDKVLGFLVARGVEVSLAHPPFNPVFWKAIQGTPYQVGLRRVEEIVAGLAEKHGLRVVGGFNPHAVGCTADMYIDAEHAGPACLGRIIDEFRALDQRAGVAQAEKRP